MSRSGLRAARAGFAVGGAILIGVGVYFLVTTEPPAAVIGLVVWLAAAVIVHDGLFAPAVNVADRLLARGAARLAPWAVAVVRILFCVGLVLTLVVGPELFAQARRHANPTLLVGDYAVRLAVVWCVIVLAVVAITAASALRTRRRSARRHAIRG
ncbi:hypothetical protein [Humibacter sp.]|uniref:hypothetical protein n=1 Tax=Humibacter sp. TaxID=1940291 RepID=UPI002D0F5D47|nr:hypothetical protein [Humibacter sp.]HVX07947.1 hypothetical protein [Humibacter sp.]